MTVAWTPHRFSGGVLALDTTNTVVLRGDPARRFDRFDDPAEIAALCRGGQRLSRARSWRQARCAVADAGRDRADGARDPGNDRPAVSRRGVRRARSRPRDLPDFLRPAPPGSTAATNRSSMRRDAVRRSGDAARLRGGARRLGAVAAARRQIARLRICPNCSWLFLDRSRNCSRLWCDMAVCGNRQKARRHYRRRRLQRERTRWLEGLSLPLIGAAAGRRPRSAPAATTGGEGEYFAISGKLFVFNYRLAKRHLSRHPQSAAADGGGPDRGRHLREPGRRRADRGAPENLAEAPQ